mmetsp:Transcript_55515/g.156258  ORF Transcript_55515/g.156258 Transcript_55515/m.156258 type:complete len:458 (+) Transcript_55515:686-2059(+)
MREQDLPRRLPGGDGGDAHPRDDQQVEGRAADDGRGAQLPGEELEVADLDHGEEDLGSRGAQGHEGEVRDGLVPDLHVDPAARVRAVPYPDVPLRARDHLDGAHELVADDADAQEHPHEPEEVEAGAEGPRPRPLELAEQWQEHCALAAGAAHEGLGLPRGQLRAGRHVEVLPEDRDADEEDGPGREHGDRGHGRLLALVGQVAALLRLGGLRLDAPGLEAAVGGRGLAEAVGGPVAVPVALLALLCHAAGAGVRSRDRERPLLLRDLGGVEPAEELVVHERPRLVICEAVHNLVRRHLPPEEAEHLLDVLAADGYVLLRGVVPEGCPNALLCEPPQGRVAQRVGARGESGLAEVVAGAALVPAPAAAPADRVGGWHGDLSGQLRLLRRHPRGVARGPGPLCPRRAVICSELRRLPRWRKGRPQHGRRRNCHRRGHRKCQDRHLCGDNSTLRARALP